MSDQVDQVREEHGMFRNVPRFLRRAIERRLQKLQEDEAAFDREALLHFARLKRLHALLHIKPGDRARAMLFEKPPEGSGRSALRELVAARKDARRATELVREHRVPYLLAEAALGKIEPPVAIALIETLDPEELLGRLPLMARRNLLEGEVREALLRRLSAIGRDPNQRFAYAKIESIVRYADLDKALASALFNLVISGVEPSALEGDTALIVDVTGSMAREGGCLDLAAGVAWRLDRALDPSAKLHVCLASTEGSVVPTRRNSGLDQWRGTFTVAVPEVPGTSLGAALEQLGRERIAVSRLVVVTDGYENRPPRLATAYERYRGQTGQRPSLHLVQPAGSATQLGIDLKNAQIPFGVFSVDPHHLGLDALIPALRTPQGQSRLAQILAFS
jgi:hypothetical protein